MPYVMVPVPEEHVEEAMAAVLRIVSRGRQVDWDQDSVTALFHDVDESARSLLSIVSRATVAGAQVTQRDLADKIEITEREIAGIVRELNDRAEQSEHPAILLYVGMTQTLPNGRTRDVRVLQMPDDVAEHVREAERLELANAPHPLTGLAE